MVRGWGLFVCSWKGAGGERGGGKRAGKCRSGDRSVGATTVSLPLLRYLPWVDLIPLSRPTTRFFFLSVGCIAIQGDDRGGRGDRYDPYEERRGSSKSGGRGRGKSGAGGFDLTGTITNGNKSEFFTRPHTWLLVHRRWECLCSLWLVMMFGRNFEARYSKRPACCRGIVRERKQPIGIPYVVVLESPRCRRF